MPNGQSALQVKYNLVCALQVYKGAFMGDTVAIKMVRLRTDKQRELLARAVALARTLRSQYLVNAPPVAGLAGDPVNCCHESRNACLACRAGMLARQRTPRGKLSHTEHNLV